MLSPTIVENPINVAFMEEALLVDIVILEPSREEKRVEDA